jgi:hypothetical protein
MMTLADSDRACSGRTADGHEQTAGRPTAKASSWAGVCRRGGRRGASQLVAGNSFRSRAGPARPGRRRSIVALGTQLVGNCQVRSHNSDTTLCRLAGMRPAVRRNGTGMKSRAMGSGNYRSALDLLASTRLRQSSALANRLFWHKSRAHCDNRILAVRWQWHPRPAGWQAGRRCRRSPLGQAARRHSCWRRRRRRLTSNGAAKRNLSQVCPI